VNHPFLVGLEHCFQTKEKIFFATRLVRGGELFQHLRKHKRFSESRTKFYGAIIALALGHLHSHHIIHRDMKPENILMDDDGYLAITDFGMAKILMNEDDKTNTFCGSLEYMGISVGDMNKNNFFTAPEVVAESGHAKEADWWGLGVLMYELMVGVPPFYHQNHSIMLRKIQKSELAFPHDLKISDEARDFIVQCLMKNPQERLGCKEDIKEIMAHPWFSDIDWDALLKKEVLKIDTYLVLLICCEDSSTFQTNFCFCNIY